MNAFASRDEMRGPLACPKPRRVGRLAGTSEPLRPVPCHQPDPLGLTVGVDFLDILLTKENPMDSAPPFFYGSPPTRSTNPIVNDSRFKEAAPVMPHQKPNPIPVAVSASARTGCARTKLGFAPAAVRIEGFDCLDRGPNRGRGIQAVA